MTHRGFNVHTDVAAMWLQMMKWKSVELGRRLYRDVGG